MFPSEYTVRQRLYRYFRQLVTLPWSPRGRTLRIERLMESTGEERDICAAIVYSQNLSLGRSLLGEEVDDAGRIARRLERGEITLPVDRD